MIRPRKSFEPGDTYKFYNYASLPIRSFIDYILKGRECYRNKDFENSRKQFENALSFLMTEIMPIVHLHIAAVLEAQKLYGNALCHIAKAMKHNMNNPSPGVFLAEATVLYLQGSIEEAMETCRTGLTLIPDLRGTSILAKKLSFMKVEIEARNMRMAHKLPYEVLYQILSQTSITDQINLAMTCHGWNRFINYNWPEMLSIIDSNHIPARTLAIHQFLGRVPGDLVREVRLEFGTTENNPGRILYDHMIAKRWSRIGTLVIRNFNRNQLCTILELNKESMQRVNLGPCDETYDSQQAMNDAIGICPNLLSLADNPLPATSQQMPTQYTFSRFTEAPSLVELSVSTKIPLSSFDYIIQSSPKLEHLKMYNEPSVEQPNCTLSDVLSVIDTHGRQLTSLAYGVSNTAVDIPVISTREQRAEVNRLRLLCIQADAPTVLIECQSVVNGIHQLIENSTDTLETLSICGSVVSILFSNNFINQLGEATVLRTLHLLAQDDQGQESREMIPPVSTLEHYLQNAHHLRYLALNLPPWIDYAVQENYLMDISRVVGANTRISTLEFGDKRNAKDGMDLSLNALVTVLRNLRHSQVRNLYLKGPRDILMSRLFADARVEHSVAGAKIVDALSQITTVQNFHLYSHNEVFSMSDMQELYNGCCHMPKKLRVYIESDGRHLHGFMPPRGEEPREEQQDENQQQPNEERLQEKKQHHQQQLQRHYDRLLKLKEAWFEAQRHKQEEARGSRRVYYINDERYTAIPHNT